MKIEKSSDPDSFNSFEHSGWDAVSNGYEKHFSGLTSQSIPTLLKMASVSSGMNVLDVCTGTGVVAEAASKLNTTVTGIDFSKEMIEISRRNHPSLNFQVADVQSLPFDDGSFDAVLCGFGIIHLPDPEKALSEVRRVLKPSGNIAVSVWDAPAPNTGFGVLYSAIKAHANMDVPLPHGPDFFQFSQDEKLIKALDGVGFKSTSTQQVKQSWVMKDPLGIFKGILEGAVRARGLILAQSDSVQKKIADDVASRMKGYLEDEVYRIPTPALIGVGSKL